MSEPEYDTRLCAWLHPDAQHARELQAPSPDTDRYAPDGTPREPVTEARLQEAGEAVRRIAQGLQFAWPGDAQALDDIADYLAGTYGAPGTHWPQRLPIEGGEVSDFEPGRWWRVTYTDPQTGQAGVWAETSNEAQAREKLISAPGVGILQRLCQRTESEWRIEQ